MIEEKFLEYLYLCKKIDYNFYEELFEYYIKYLNLKTVNNIIFNNNEKSYYEFNKKTINLNLNELYSIVLFDSYTINSSYDQILYINSQLLAYLLHEIIHAKQKNIVKGYENANKIVIDALKKSFKRAYFHKKIYEEFHDYFIIEYNANIESQLMVKDFLNNLNLEYNLYHLNQILKYGYNVISPIEREYKLLNKDLNIEKIENDKDFQKLSDNEKIIYGFPIKKEKIIMNK